MKLVRHIPTQEHPNHWCGPLKDGSVMDDGKAQELLESKRLKEHDN